MERWPVSLNFSSPPQTPTIGLLRLTPHSARGKTLLPTFDRGHLVRFDLGGKMYRARIACRKVDGTIFVHAIDVLRNLVLAVVVAEDRFAKHLRAATRSRVARRD